MMNIKLRKDFENLKENENYLICVKGEEGEKEFKIGLWCEKTPLLSLLVFPDVEGEGMGFYSEELDSWGDLILRKQEKVLGFISMKDIEVE